MSFKGKQTLHHPPRSTDDELPTSWQRERQTACLRIELESGEIYVLPYQHFVAAHLSRSNDAESLKISFSTHEVSIEGSKLRELALALSDLVLASIAEVPLRYQKSASGTKIIAIRVAAVE